MQPVEPFYCIYPLLPIFKDQLLKSTKWGGGILSNFMTLTSANWPSKSCYDKNAFQLTVHCQFAGRNQNTVRSSNDPNPKMTLTLTLKCKWTYLYSFHVFEVEIQNRKRIPIPNPSVWSWNIDQSTIFWRLIIQCNVNLQQYPI